MDQVEIDKVIREFQGGAEEGIPELLETHISWLILGKRHVYKIKKPVRFSFVDFSTLEKRKYYCEREILLNRRLTSGIYLDVQAIHKTEDQFIIGGESGEIIEYAVKMNRVDNGRQLDRLLLLQQVKEEDITRLARKIAAFHQHADIATYKNPANIRFDFNDLKSERGFLSEKLGDNAGKLVSKGIEASDHYLEKNISLITKRLEEGFFRDCHGDLHSGNIFMLQEPQPFDCLEFNDELRRIDVLNEVAFLCMDLEAFNRKKMADLFLATYNNQFNAIRNEQEEKLFLYYKCYRANIRAKVCSIRARSAADKPAFQQELSACRKYLLMMDEYLQLLNAG